jgi:hypothetical protein
MSSFMSSDVFILSSCANLLLQDGSNVAGLLGYVVCRIGCEMYSFRRSNVAKMYRHACSRQCHLAYCVGAMEGTADKPPKKRARRSTASQGAAATPVPTRAPRAAKSRKLASVDEQLRASKEGTTKKGKGKGAPRRSGRAHQKTTPPGPTALNWDDYEDLEEALGNGSDEYRSGSEEDEYEEDFEDDAVDPDVSEDEDFVECVPAAAA